MTEAKWFAPPKAPDKAQLSRPHPSLLSGCSQAETLLCSPQPPKTRRRGGRVDPPLLQPFCEAAACGSSYDSFVELVGVLRRPSHPEPCTAAGQTLSCTPCNPRLGHCAPTKPGESTFRRKWRSLGAVPVWPQDHLTLPLSIMLEGDTLLCIPAAELLRRIGMFSVYGDPCIQGD